MKNSDSQILPSNSYAFLKGGGEMGTLIRTKEWSKTPLGNPATWPQSLRTMVSVMLDNPFGMYIAWGKEYTQIYNDGYRPILGTTKHPEALGISTRETFKEIWHIIESMFDGVMNGQAVGFPDFMLPLNRNGFEEDCYFDFSYSPIRKEDGEVGGVLVTVIETTNKKKAEADLKESKDQLQFAIEAAELGTWDYNPLTNKFTGNNRLKDWFGLQHDAEIELSLALEVMAEKDRSPVAQAIQRALDYESGGLYNIEYSIINALTRQERIVSAKGRAWFGEDKKAYRFNGTLEDITEQAIARKKIEESEHRFRFILEKAHDPILILKGENMVLEIANDPLLKLWGIDKNAFGKTFLEILPEMKEQGFFDMLQDVYFNDKIIKGIETPVTFNRPDKTKEIIYFNFIYQPYREDDGQITGVLVTASDVTSQVQAKKQVEESEEQLRIALEGGELGTFDYFPLEDKLLWSAKTKELFGLPPEATVNYDLYIQALHPEDRNTSQAIAQQKMILQNGGLYDIEYRTIGITDGKLRWLRSKGIATYDVNNNPVRYTGVIQEITERKKSEQALQESEQRFRAIADNISQLAWMTDEQGEMIWFNKRWIEYTGITIEKMQVAGSQHVHHPDHWHRAISNYRQSMQAGKEWEDTFPLMGTDGQYRWFLTRAIPIKNAAGKALKWFGTNTDITERMEAEEALKESEERFCSIANDMAAFVFTGDADTNVDFVNRQWLEFVGLSSQEGLGKAWAAVTHPDDVAPMIAIYTDAVANHTRYEFEIRQRNKNGEYCWILWKGIPRITKNGLFDGMIGVGIDITDRKAAEDALYKQQEETKKLQRLYEAVTGNTPDLVYIFDLNYRFTYANSALLTMWGKTWEEAIGKSLLENGYEPWHAAMHEREIDEVVITKKPIRGTVSFPHAELGNRIYDYIFAPVLNNDGDVEAIAGTTRDITDINKAEEELLKSEQQIRTMVETAPFPIGVYIGREMIIQFANPSIINIWGKGNDVIGKSYKEILPELDNQEIFKQLDSVYTTGVPYHATNQKIDIVTNQETTSFYFNYSFTPLTDADGKIYGVMNTAADVTDLNLVKLAIQKSEQNLRSTILQAPVAMCIFKGENFIVDMANERMFELWGKPAEAVMQKPIFEGLPEVKDQGFEEILQGVYTTGKTFSADGVPVTLPRNGVIEQVYVNFVYEPYREADGIVSGILAVAIDVTAQITAHKKIEENEEKLNIVINASELGTWEWDMASNNITYSYKYLQIFGYKEQETLSHEDLLKHFHPDDIPVRNRAMKIAYDSGNLDYSSRIIWKDGSVHWMQAKGKIFYSEDGKPVKAVGTIRDITNEKNYQQELEEREETFRLLADSVPQHIWTADTQGNLNYYNQSVYDYSGLTRQQIDKDGWIQIVHPDDREANIKAWINAVTSGNNFHFEHRFQRHDGVYRWQLSRAVPQKDAEGNIQMWVGTSTDIQEMKEHDQQKDDFISIASHEMKTPLTTAKGYIELLQILLTEENKTALLYAAKANQAVERLHGLVTEMLDASKIQNGQLNYNISTFDFNEMIDETIENMQHTAKNHLILKMGTVVQQVTGDKDRLQQVLINLLSNAIKYSPKADKVFIKAEEQPGKIQVSVQDFGVGMSRQHVDKIFDRYYRVQEHAVHFQGLGIGLYISSNIIQRHAGSMWADSEPGKGSTFYFTIPLHSA